MADITIALDGGAVPGYLARPASESPADAWPGIVVIHELFGLNDDIRGKADQLAEHGYLALAPDLYRGKSWVRCVVSAISQVRSGSGPAFLALDAARATLASRADCTGKVGVIGFCLGGGFALLCAPRPGFSAAAVNYGDVPRDAQGALGGACPVIGSFGRRDAMGVKPPARLEEALTALEIPHEVKVYPDSGHRFMSQASGAGATLAKVTRMEYNADDADDAWRRIHAFFGEYLSG